MQCGEQGRWERLLHTLEPRQDWKGVWRGIACWDLWWPRRIPNHSEPTFFRNSVAEVGDNRWTAFRGKVATDLDVWFPCWPSWQWSHRRGGRLSTMPRWTRWMPKRKWRLRVPPHRFSSRSRARNVVFLPDYCPSLERIQMAFLLLLFWICGRKCVWHSFFQPTTSTKPTTVRRRVSFELQGSKRVSNNVCMLSSTFHTRVARGKYGSSHSAFA